LIYDLLSEDLRFGERKSEIWSSDLSHFFVKFELLIRFEILLQKVHVSSVFEAPNRFG